MPEIFRKEELEAEDKKGTISTSTSSSNEPSPSSTATDYLDLLGPEIIKSPLSIRSFLIMFDLFLNYMPDEIRKNLLEEEFRMTKQLREMLEEEIKQKRPSHADAIISNIDSVSDNMVDKTLGELSQQAITFSNSKGYLELEIPKIEKAIDLLNARKGKKKDFVSETVNETNEYRKQAFQVSGR
jgi:hypothetical protein